MAKTLEIVLISAEGLKQNRKPVKRKTFGVVKVNDKSKTSSIHESGGNSPIWNDKFDIEMPNNEFIFVEVFCRTGGAHVKQIGKANIPVSDFTGTNTSPPDGHLNFLSYRLRDEFGDKCGIVNVSILVKKSAMAATIKDYGVCSTQSTAVTVATAGISGYGGGIVTGVPVWCMIQRRPS